MADDVAPQPEELPGAGISDGSPRDPAPETPNPADPRKPNSTKPAAAPTNTATAEQPQPKDPGYDGSQFLPNQTAMALKQALNIKALDPHLEEMLRTARLRLTNDKSGLLIDMTQNGHSIHCGKNKDGVEFIGMPNKKMIVDTHDAHVMIGLAKGRGWKSVNINGGTQQEQDLLWIEAMRQGLGVSNYQPDPNSAVAKKWIEEYMAAPNQAVTEAKEDFHVKTMQLLQEKAGAMQDKDAKAGVETILAKFKDGTAITGNADIYKALETALSDKNERSAYNAAADFLNKAEPKLALAKIDATAPAANPATPQPAVKTDAPVPA